MRFKSKLTGGFQVFAVSGINTTSFAITADSAAQKGLLGFAVQRAFKQGKLEFRPGFKVFRSVLPKPTPATRVSTEDHPVQSFVWDDFTCQPESEYRYVFHPLKGTPGNLDRSTPPIEIRIKTEPLFSKQQHDVFFNRGVASSQAYAVKFGNKKPKKLPAKKRQEALDWLSRSLDEAILEFIKQAKRGDSLLCCFYEFRYRPVAEALKAAIQRGVNVRIIVDAKDNGNKKKKIAPFPRNDNLKLIKAVDLPPSCVIQRTARKSAIQHNKFMVLLKGKKQTAAEVWTGSTNISEGGIFGQTNVGHWVRNPAVARKFKAYWDVLSKNPGAVAGGDQATSRKLNAAFRKQVEAVSPFPKTVKSIPTGVTPVFSPRSTLQALTTYFKLADSADNLACITLAFGVSTELKAELVDNTPDSALVLMLLEKEDRPTKPKPGAKTKPKPFVKLTAQQNIYQAFGEFLRDPLYRFAQETNTKAMKVNGHVAYIHSKFLLVDPLGDDPIVVTGSANFSAASTKENDENMLIIRGDCRTADIYFTEFNRLFNHYYFRAVHQKLAGKPNAAPASDSVFLAERPAAWLSKYKPGRLRHKRVQIFAKMKKLTRP
ncbi:MAG: hypothetical protein K1X74_20480 [Pirellulales bacterium]|nr:hypothetical protein [Pirellulales bacterium]